MWASAELSAVHGSIGGIGLRRSVRVALTRQQMFTLGYRPQTIHRLTLGTEVDGSLLAVKHDSIANTSRFEHYQEPTVIWSGALYHCEHSAVSAKLVPVDLFTPCDMRAPGGAVGSMLWKRDGRTELCGRYRPARASPEKLFRHGSKHG